MKNFTNNFKQFTSHLSARWLIMALMMLVGTSSAWADKVFYLDLSKFDSWKDSNAKFSVNYFGGGVTQSFTGFATSVTIDGKSYYKATGIPDAATTIIWVRHNSSAFKPDWNNKWNQTGDLTISSANGKNVVKITGWGAGSWSETVSECKTAKITWGTISETMSKGSTQTISTTLTSGAGSVTYTSSDNSVITVNGSVLTAVGNGTATITAKHSTVSPGYCTAEDIKKTITVTCTTCCTDYYIAGISNWNANADKMSCDNNIWSKKFTDKDAGSYKFKVTNGSWNTDLDKDNEWTAFDNSKGNITCSGGNGNDIQFTTTSEGNITISFNGTKAWVTWEANCSTPKTPSIASSHSSICSGDNTEVTITVTGDADTYALYVVNNGYTKQSNEAVNNKFTVSPTKTTTYVVKAFNGACASDNYSDDVTVEVNTKPNITLTEESKAICKGDELDLSTFASSTVDLTWWNGQTQITAPVSPEQNTTYTVKAVNGACTVTKDFPVTVNALPSAPGLGNPASSQCVTANGTVNLNTLASPVGIVNWYNSSSQLISNATVSIVTAGTFTYTAKAVSNGCESSEGTSFTLTVKEQLDKPTLSVTNIIKCANTHTDGTIVIENYNNANTYVLKKDSKPIEKIYKEGYLITKDEIGSYTVEVSKDGACGATSDVKNIDITDNTPSATVTVNADRERLCADNDVVLTCDVKNLDGTITNYVWKNANGEQVATGEALSTITIKNVTASTTYSVVVTVVKNGCSKDFEASVNLDVKSRPEAPKFDDEKLTACTGVPFSLPMPNNLKEGEEPVWTIEDKLIPAGNVTLDEKGDYEFKAYKNDGCISDATKFIVTVNPSPTITLSANNANVSVNEVVTLTASGSDYISLEWSATDGTKSYTVTPGENNTATITTDENALITVTVVAKSVNGCETSASIDLTFGSEDCENANADYIEILCRRTTSTTTTYRDMYCYAWDPNTDKTYLGGWPGVKTDDGNFEYKGNKYAVWQIKTNTDLSIIFNNNSGRQTDDISGLKKGYRYVYEIKESTSDGSKYTYELKEEPSIIFTPEVKTLSATYARQSDNSLKVTVTGKIMKKGCASISSYGFQYMKDGGDYTNVDVCSSNCDQDAGFIFTKDITLEAGKYGEYIFRARLINENSSKVYGEKITIYYSESDVLIAAVGDDEIVTNKSGVYYDFVGLYVKNVMLPEGAKVKSYQWYKGDAVYNGGNVTVADRGVSAANNNIRPNEAGAYKCVVTLDNDQTLTSNVINVTSTNTYNDKVNASNRNLPVISVRTNVAFPTCATAGTDGKFPSTNIEGWKEKRSVDVKIFNADGTLYYDRKARMNYRGSSSLNFNKKSYAFCPGAANCGGKNGADYVKKEALNLFGLSGGAIDEDWVLYAAAADPTLMRNRLVFDTYAKMTGEWGVNSMFVELVIDGEYQGVYVLMDKITNNEKRVYVGTYGDDEKKDYNGGFIVKFDKTDVADRERNLVAGQEIGDEKTFRTVRTGRTDVYTYGTHVDQLFEIEYPEKKDVEEAGASWSTTLNAIKQRFQDFEDALEKGEFLKVRSIIDYESWADWFIINEFTKNLDAYRASCVFTCKGEGQKIEALPLWDQELSFNNGAANIAGKGADKTNGLLIENDGVYKDCFPAPFWFTGRVSYFNNCGADRGESSENPRLEYYLLKDECFIQTIKERWKIHIAEGGALHKKTLTTKVGALLTELGAAKDRETTKWPSDHRVSATCNDGDTGYKDVSFDTSKGTLDAWVGGELNADATSESSSNSRVTNLNYLINQMQGDPLQFNLVLNPGNGVTTPWVPVTLTVEAPAGYDYTYDDSEVEAAEGVIIKKLGNDAYSYTFPRPEAWGTGNDANASDPRDPRQYGVKVTLNVETVDNTCGTVDTEKHATITLEDEGDDNCSYTDK